MDMDVDIETMIDMKIGMENEEAFVCELCYTKCPTATASAEPRPKRDARQSRPHGGLRDATSLGRLSVWA